MTETLSCKALEEVNQQMAECGMKHDCWSLDHNNNWAIYIGKFYKRSMSILFNCCNGHFLVFDGLTGQFMADHNSRELDETDWYHALRHIFYAR